MQISGNPKAPPTTRPIDAVDQILHSVKARVQEILLRTDKDHPRIRQSFRENLKAALRGLASQGKLPYLARIANEIAATSPSKDDAPSRSLPAGPPHKVSGSRASVASGEWRSNPGREVHAHSGPRHP